jgi:aspartyl-tRNA(Asn)/glutamyl-tRNA(Gln) amidotransferase subunit B
MWQANELSATSAVAIATEMVRSDHSPQQIAEARNLLMVQDTDQTARWVEEAFAANPQAVQDALHNPKKAKASAGFLRGAVMKLSGSKADPKLVGGLIEKKLSDLRSPAQP